MTPLEKLQFVLPAMIAGLHFIVIVICAIFIHSRIRGGTLSKKIRDTQKKRLFLLIIQVFFFLSLVFWLFQHSFIVVVIFELPIYDDEYFVCYVAHAITSLRPSIIPESGTKPVMPEFRRGINLRNIDDRADSRLSNLVCVTSVSGFTNNKSCSVIPCSSFHPLLNALIILVMTSNHRRFIGKKIFVSRSSTVSIFLLL